jgi:hypothetical protein
VFDIINTESEVRGMTKEEIINGLEIYTVGRLKNAKVDITVEELQKFIDAIKETHGIKRGEDK